MPQTAAWTVVGTAELPAVQKWHISRSRYSWPVVWRGPASRVEEVYLIWSLYLVDEQNGWVCWAFPPQRHGGRPGAGSCVWAVHGAGRGPGGCEPLGSVTWTLCVRDPKLHGLLLQLSCLACHLEKRYLFLSPVSKNKHLTKFGLFLELRRVFEKLIYRLSPSCELRSFLIWPAEDTKSVLPKWHHGMICTSHLHMQCKFVIWANKYW